MGAGRRCRRWIGYQQPVRGDHRGFHCAAAGYQSARLRRDTVSKALTGVWGALAIVLAFWVDDIASTVLVAVNKLGSLINGPLLAVFVMGLLTPRLGGVRVGFVAGLSALLWLGARGFLAVGTSAGFDQSLPVCLPAQNRVVAARTVHPHFSLVRASSAPGCCVTSRSRVRRADF